MLVLTPLQPRDVGQGKDVDCDALIAQVQNQDPQGLVLKDVQKLSVKKTIPPKRVTAEQHSKNTWLNDENSIEAPGRSVEHNRTE